MGKPEPMLVRSGWFFLAAVMIVLASHLVACGSGGPGDRQGVETAERPNLILLTVDTWRGDHFLTQQGGIRLTPNLEQLAAESMVFDQAASVACATSAGVAGILTGLIPRRSGVVVNNHRLPATIPTLATMVRDLGYRTAAFVANPVIEPGHGFERGFETYELIRKERPRRKARAEKVNERGLAWLDNLQGEEPFFLWLHYMEPHGPYEPPPETLDLFALEDFGGSREIALLPRRNNSGHGGIPSYQQYRQKTPAREASYYTRRYTAEVRAMDEQAGNLVDALRQRGVFEEAIFILSADHGEALDADHGFYFSHGHGLTEDQVSVPLLLRCPGCERGKRLRQPVSTADILPTVASLLHIEGMEVDGTSLLDINPLNPAPRDVVSQFSRAFSLRLGNWKLRSSRAGVFLHDLAADPEESRDLRSVEAERFQQLRRRLGEIRHRPALAAPEVRGEVSAERRKILEALGYL